MQMSCFCPREKFEPESSTLLYTFFLMAVVYSGSSLIWSHSSTFFRVSAISSSLYLLKGSMFVLIVPVKRVGSWGIMVTFWRREWSPNSEISSPSRTIFPTVWSSFSASSRILSKPSVRVDLPLPVRPTTPIFSFDLMSNEIFLMTKGN